MAFAALCGGENAVERQSFFMGGRELRIWKKPEKRGDERRYLAKCPEGTMAFCADCRKTIFGLLD